MLIMIGSMSEDSPKKKKSRRKGKATQEIVPYQPTNLVPTDSCFIINTEMLDTHNTCVFKGSFNNPQGKKVGLVMLPDTFFDVNRRKECKDMFHRVGLKGYYDLPPWGIDIQRSYELMTSINEDGGAEITHIEAI